jgi:iron(III) transport system substrate-binding protein
VQTAVAGGEKLYGMIVDFLPIRAKADGAPVEFVFPEEGVSYVTEPVAILSTAQNPDAAKAFVDFILSREGQELAAAQGYLPAHPDVTPPAGFPPRSEIRLLDFDPAKRAGRGHREQAALHGDVRRLIAPGGAAAPPCRAARG